ncbi:hypothetical protein M378DRAFT_165678 [Amanita muscaria Koide BX008]|uniref:Uncharacterized protein n=1 Tax=Amanita muscaria (strain Koide BX008) TaxID=946122 RepID=A0A0C2SH62_AMAMK|nr:hypothetical protein M378DRAFT_165678 [Amanita muscaria Koide BX008]
MSNELSIAPVVVANGPYYFVHYVSFKRTRAWHYFDHPKPDSQQPCPYNCKGEGVVERDPQQYMGLQISLSRHLNLQCKYDITAVITFSAVTKFRTE